MIGPGVMTGGDFRGGVGVQFRSLAGTPPSTSERLRKYYLFDLLAFRP